MNLDTSQAPPARAWFWKWWVCGLLLLATMINYMDRLTLNLSAVRIMDDLGLNDLHYAQLESGFAFAFALGAIIAGWMADRWNVYWIYPIAVLAWSAAGFATGVAQGFVGLLVCRFLLGLAEASNWPCALRTTQHLLPPHQRTLGNGILQSGAALGAVITPLVVMALLTDDPASWRYPFFVVGAVGATWAILWWLSIRPSDLRLAKVPPSPSLVSILFFLIGLLGVDIAVHRFPIDFEGLPIDPQLFPLLVKIAVTALGIAGVSMWLMRVTRDDTNLSRAVFFRRFWVLVTLVIAINTAWHFFRAWLPLFLQKQHAYTETQTSWFILGYYVATDIGSLSAGFVALYLARSGFSVHASRSLVFFCCACLTTLSLAVAHMSAGPLMLAIILVIGFGALGLFPNYYSFSQELTVQHQGKLTGALGCINWLAMSLLHELVGDSIKRTGSYSQGVALAGLVPMVGVLALLFFWGRTSEPEPELSENAAGR